MVCGTSKQGHTMLFTLCWTWFLNIFTLYHHHKSHFCCQYSSVIPLLDVVYSLCQIQDWTSLGRSTVGSISEEVLGDKQNYPRGCPSKLSCHDWYSIIQQISSGRLDNAVQVTQFTNATISSLVTLQNN